MKFHLQGDKGNAIHKKTLGRWTSVRKETEEADDTSVRRKPVKGISFAKSG